RVAFHDGGGGRLAEDLDGLADADGDRIAVDRARAVFGKAAIFAGLAGGNVVDRQVVAGTHKIATEIPFQRRGGIAAGGGGQGNAAAFIGILADGLLGDGQRTVDRQAEAAAVSAAAAVVDPAAVGGFVHFPCGSE